MRVNSIQVLRAVAVTLVVYEHSMDLQITFSKSAQQSFFHLNNFGCIGVDLFFVISGFIITFIASKYSGVKDGLGFLRKRFLRINPIYYLVSIILLVIQYLDSKINHTSFKADSVANSLSDTMLIIPFSGEMSTFKPLLIVGWTLSFEWAFYLLFFISIILKKGYQLILPGLILTLVLIGFYVKPFDFRLIFFSNPIILEFLLGIIICWLYLKIKTVPAYLSLLFLVTGTVLYVFMVFYGFGKVWHYKGVLTGDISFQRFLIWGIPSALIVAGSVFLEKKSKLKTAWNNRWVLLVGDASYSIYLVHIPVAFLLYILYKRVGYFIPADLSIMVHTIVCVLAGIFFFKIVENPFLQTIKKTRLDDFEASIKMRTVTKPA